MVLQSSGAISLSNIQTEFGGTNPISISEYYGAAAGVPSSGAIDFSDFYGKSSTPAPATGRGVFGGGGAPTLVNTIDYITIATTGNATDFGDLSVGRNAFSACSSSTRGVFGGGGGGPAPTANLNLIEYITIATTGNATDFGDLSLQSQSLDACSSSTRGVFGGGFLPLIPTPVILNSISYITIATTGNGIDFGDLTLARLSGSSCSSSTRGVFGGGATPANVNTIDYITIATTGNATDFGDLIAAKDRLDACSSSTRGVFSGGATAPTTFVNTIEYITIATTGNTTDFGDITSGGKNQSSSCSSLTRGIFGGGGTPPAVVNTIDYITIATTGNTTDFGDLTLSRFSLSACSDSHGGLDGGGGGGGGGSGRGVFGGGQAAGAFNIIDYITIATTGNATNFGDLTLSRPTGACSSSTRGVFGGGNLPSPAVYYNTIDYITIATTGNAIDFGDLTVARFGAGACSSSTRGVFGGGVNTSGYLNTIDYITIATTGNAIDFGDLSAVGRAGVSGCSSSTRGIFDAGFTNTPIATYFNIIDYITIATTGNAIDFGDLTLRRTIPGSCSSSTRGVFGGGGGGTVYYNTIDYITIATTGNAIDFGDLINLVRGGISATSNNTRGVFGGGLNTGGYLNTIDYVTIATTGNTTDFGDLTSVRSYAGACSDSHGGLA